MVSIIVPIYMVEKYLDDCIRSIVGQTYKNIEIILVDDGSTDSCPQKCDEWAHKDSRIKVIHKVNGGLSDARNAGIAVAKGEFLMFVDSDDWIREDMIEKMISEMKDAHDVDICSCGICNVYSDGRRISREISKMEGNAETIIKELYNNCNFPVSSWGKLYRSGIWEDLGFPLGKICEDAFTTPLLIDRAKDIVQIPDQLYFYRIREDSIMTSAFSPKRMDEEEAWRFNYTFIKRNYPSLYKNAYSFYLLKVENLIQCISKDQKKEAYPLEFSYLKDILRENIFYVLFKSTMPAKNRIKYILDWMLLCH